MLFIARFCTFFYFAFDLFTTSGNPNGFSISREDIQFLYRLLFIFIKYPEFKYFYPMSKIGQLVNRPKIFEQWPRSPTKLMPVMPTQPNRGSKQNESLRAEEALHKSLMLITNIKNFLQKKDQISSKYQVYMNRSNGHKKKLEEITRYNNQNYDGKKYKESLKNYYQHIRQQTKYLQSTEYFILSNLPNYDNKVSKMRQQINKQQKAREQLQGKLDHMESIRKLLQQSLTMYEENENRRPKSNILANTSYYQEYNFELCLQLMQKQLSEQNLIQLHYLMQYQIRTVEKQLNQFISNIKDDKDSYSVYEAIYDSINLMNVQQEEMKRDRLQMSKQFAKLDISNASTIVPLSSNSLHILLKNEKVYDSNMELLARYNAETNLTQYAEKRKKYAERLGKFKKSLSKWKQQQQIATFLYTRQQLYTNYGKLVQISDKTKNPVQLKDDKELLKKAYYQCMSYQVPEGMIELSRYRQQITNHMRTLFENENIAVDRMNDHLQPQSYIYSLQNRIVSDQNKYRKYLNFFVQLESAPDSEKALFLMDQMKNIRAMKYQLSQMNPETQASFNYITYLTYCEIIADHQITGQDLEYKSKVELNRTKKWTSLPPGLQVLLFNYTIDVNLKKQAEQHIQKAFEPIMKNLKANIENELNFSYNSTLNSENVQQFPKKFLQLSADDRQFFFINFCRKISNFSKNIKSRLIDYYWSIGKKYIIASYQSRAPQIINLSIQKKDFFKFRILSYLAIQGSQLKISNLLQLIQYYMDYAERFSGNNWSQIDIFLQVVRQCIFIQFLKNNAAKKFQLAPEIYAMERINEAFILLYETNQYLQAEHIAKLNNQMQLQDYFEYGVKIHKSWIELETSTKRNKLMEQKKQLFHKFFKIFELIKKSPINLATKANLQAIESVINFRNKLNKLKIINQLNIEPNSGFNSNLENRMEMTFISAAYVRVLNFIDIYENSNNQFAPSDIVMIRDNNTKVLYLEQLRALCQTQLSKMIGYLSSIMGVYRSNMHEQNKKSSVLGNNWSELFNSLIKKLQKLKNQQMRTSR